MQITANIYYTGWTLFSKRVSVRLFTVQSDSKPPSESKTGQEIKSPWAARGVCECVCKGGDCMGGVFHTKHGIDQLEHLLPQPQPQGHFKGSEKSQNRIKVRLLEFDL